MTTIEDTSSPPMKRKKYEEISLGKFTEKILAKVFVKLYEKTNQNYAERLQMYFDPNCSPQTSTNLRVIPRINLNYIFIEVSVNMWFEALDLSFLFTTSDQYLPGIVLKAIVEIMLHAHYDLSSQYTINEILNKCQQVLALHFRMHPPHPDHHNIINVYTELLKGKPHNSKECIVQYCFNRLMDDISSDSEDGPLKNIEKLPDNAENLQYQINTKHESLDRTKRIDRTMAVLESLIELLQMNLLMLVKNRKRGSLMSQLLTSKEEDNKGDKVILKLSDQIIELFAYFIHLDYPEHYIGIMSLWLNVVIETDVLTNHDYDDPLEKSTKMVKYIYGIIIKEFPYESVNKIFERIKPSYMKFMIGYVYCKTLLNQSTENFNYIDINFMIRHLESEQDSFNWNDFSNTEIETDPKKILDHLASMCLNSTISTTEVEVSQEYKKKITVEYKPNITPKPNIIRNAIYITLEAFFDLFDIYNIHTKFEETETNSEKHKYDKYKNIHQMLKQFIVSLRDLTEKYGPVPENLKVFKFILSLEEKQ